MDYLRKTDLEAIVELTAELSDLAAAVAQAPHPPVPNDVTESFRWS